MSAQLGVTIAVLVLALLGLWLFGAETPDGAFRRPLGLMVIATLIHVVVAVAVGSAVWVIWPLGDRAQEWAPIAAAAATLLVGVLIPLYAWWCWSAERWKPMRARDLATIQAHRDLTSERLKAARTLNDILILERQRLERGDPTSSEEPNEIVERLDAFEQSLDSLGDESDDTPLTQDEIDARREEIRLLSQELRHRRGKS